MTRREGTPDPSWSDVELLDWVDNALRNGNQMTRANLAFEYLLDRFGYDRRQLPGYVADMEALKARDAAGMPDLGDDSAWAATVNPFEKS